MQPHFIRNDADDNEDLELAFVSPASQNDVAMVLAQDTTGHNGRSEWCWVRLRNGDLVLGVFPQGETYEAVSEKAPFGDM